MASKATGVQIKINDHSLEVKKALNQKLGIILNSIGLECETYAKKDCPVDTGRLRNSIAHKAVLDEKAVYVGTNVEYGPKVEFTEMHHRVGKAHFLRDAAANHGDHYKAIAEAILKA